MADQSYHLVKTAGDARYEIDTDRARLDLRAIHGFLANSHWARGIPLSVLQREIAKSLPFGLYKDGRQVGFARVVTDAEIGSPSTRKCRSSRCHPRGRTRSVASFGPS